MAGDWLKIEACTPEKREVMAITLELGWDDPDLTVGKLFKLWRWFDQQTLEGNAASVTPALLDRIIGVTGFSEAVESVGWLTIKDGGIELPNFDRHNGETAKKRALAAKRAAKYKGNAKSNAASVTPALPREEKRREEKNYSDKQINKRNGVEKFGKFADLPELPDGLAADDLSDSRLIDLVLTWWATNGPYVKERGRAGPDVGGAVVAFRSAEIDPFNLTNYVATALHRGVAAKYSKHFNKIKGLR